MTTVMTRLRSRPSKEDGNAPVPQVNGWEWVPPKAPAQKVVVAVPTRRKRRRPRRPGFPVVVSLVLGIICAGIGTALWVGVGPADPRYGRLLAPIVGVFVGLAVRFRAARSTVTRPVMAVLLTAVSAAFGQFLVEQTIKDGGHLTKPTLADLRGSVSLVQKVIERDPIVLVLWLLAVVMAGAFASQADR